MRKGQTYLKACTRKYLWACPVQPGKLTLLTYSKHRFIYFKAQVFLALMLSDILSNEYYDTHEYYLVCVVKIKCVTVGNMVGWAGRSSRRVNSRSHGWSVCQSDRREVTQSVCQTDGQSVGCTSRSVGQSDWGADSRSRLCLSITSCVISDTPGILAIIAHLSVGAD